MSQEQKDAQRISDGDVNGAMSAAVHTPKKTPAPNRPRELPPYKVLLHNDDINEMEHVVLSILKITTLSLAEAEKKMFEAHRTGIALLVVTHKERAELYEEQFRSFNLTVTIEPAD